MDFRTPSVFIFRGQTRTVFADKEVLSVFIVQDGLASLDCLQKFAMQYYLSAST